MKTTQAKLVKPLFAVSAAAMLVCGGLAKADDGMKVSGFVDAGYTWTKGSNNNTFGINDGAIYVTKSLDKGRVMLDLPFMYSSATSADFTFATTKAQAYVAYDYDFGFSWKLGQFDRIYGIQANDTWDIPFTKLGSVNALFPKVHTGLMLTYSMDPVQFSILGSNPRDKGQMSGNIPDFGAKISFASQMARFHAAWLQEQNTGGSSSVSLYDFMLGYTHDALTADLGLTFGKPAVGDTYSGYILTLTYGFTDMIRGEFRSELMKKYVNDTVVDFTLGPQFAMSKDMVVKFDYTLTSTKVTSGADSVTDHSAAIEALHRF